MQENNAKNQIGVPDNPVMKDAKPWKVLSLVLALLLLLASSGLVYIYQNNTLDSTPQNNSDTAPAATQQEEHKTEEWTRTDISGAGVTFEYPKNWHVASYDQLFHQNLISNYEGYHLVFLSEVPFHVLTTHGVGSDFVIARKNGMNNPQSEFEELLNSERELLSQNSQDLSEEVLTSEYFDEIIHMTGTRDQWQGSAVIDKYFMMLTDPQKKSSESFNENIIIVERISNNPGTADVLRKIVMSIKECHFTWCLEE